LTTPTPLISYTHNGDDTHKSYRSKCLTYEHVHELFSTELDAFFILVMVVGALSCSSS